MLLYRYEEFRYAEFCYADAACLYAEYRYAACYCADSQGDVKAVACTIKILQS